MRACADVLFYFWSEEENIRQEELREEEEKEPHRGDR